MFISDDEYLERTLLKYSIPWEEYGVMVAGEAGSGKELLTQLDKEQPDILLTDICMPCMDGLALSRVVRERYRNIDIVILSGHRNFDYAKEAIGIGVSEYLLKPVDQAELGAAIKRIRERRIERAVSREQTADTAVSSSKPGEIVGNAIRYITAALTDSSLSLNSVSKKLYVSPSYLSRIFKQEVGENLSDYVARLRIAQSAEYLKHTNLRAYEISEKMGFHDSHYFSLCFKKYMGKTVQDYRKECMIPGE